MAIAESYLGSFTRYWYTVESDLSYLSSMPEGTGTLLSHTHTETGDTAIWIVYTQIKCILFTLVTIPSIHICLKEIDDKKIVEFFKSCVSKLVFKFYLQLEVF